MAIPSQKVVESEWITINEALALGGFGRNSLYRAASRGAFSIRKLGKRSLINREEFRQFLHGLPRATLRAA